MKNAPLIDWPWKVDLMDVPVLKKYGLFDIFPGYNDIECTHDDWLFVEDLLKQLKAPITHFYNLLWLVGYYKKEFDYFLPMEWYEQQEEIKKEKREIEFQKFQTDIRKALDKKKRSRYEPITMKGNKDTRETNFTVSASHQVIQNISFTINGRSIKTNDRKFSKDFLEFLNTKILTYSPNIKGLKQGTKKQAIHTMAIERMINAARFLNNEGVVKNENQVYRVITEMLRYYNFEFTNRLDAVSQVKNTLKKIGFIAVKKARG